MEADGNFRFKTKKKKSPLKSFGFALFFLSSEVSLCTEIVSFLTLIVQSVSQSMSDVGIKKKRVLMYDVANKQSMVLQIKHETF